MPTLAPKLPWQHAFAGGYPRRGGQPLPTDPDAIDYLNRVAAADGASVEVGIAQAIDAFVRGCKADSAGYAGDPTRSNWDAIKASCIMCGARTLSGALVPLKGTAPTAFGSWASGDYSRSGATPGLKGDGTTKYLNTNRANNADGQNDKHLAVYSTSTQVGGNIMLAGAADGTNATRIYRDGAINQWFIYDGNSGDVSSPVTNASLVGLVGLTRSVASAFSARIAGTSVQATAQSVAYGPLNHYVFAQNSSGSASNVNASRLAFYSLGAAIDLAALDERVTNLVTAIRFHSLTGLLPNDYDPATIAYIVSGISAGGTL